MSVPIGTRALLKNVVLMSFPYPLVVESGVEADLCRLRAGHGAQEFQQVTTLRPHKTEQKHLNWELPYAPACNLTCADLPAIPGARISRALSRPGANARNGVDVATARAQVQNVLARSCVDLQCTFA